MTADDLARIEVLAADAEALTAFVAMSDSSAKRLEGYRETALALRSLLAERQRLREALQACADAINSVPWNPGFTIATMQATEALASGHYLDSTVLAPPAERTT